MSDSKSDIVAQYVAHMADRSARKPQDHSCYICCEENAIVRYNERDMCLYCGADFLLHFIMPEVAPLFASHDQRVSEAIAFVEQHEHETPAAPTSPFKSDVTHPMSSGAPAASEWVCWKCTYGNSVFSEVCDVCHAQRPIEPTCPRCNSDYTLRRTCPADRKPHRRWECDACKTLNLEELVECRACQKAKTWFCANCSLENAATAEHCEVCGGGNKLASLKSFVNREMLKATGLDLAEADVEREQSRMTAEHTERLAYRIRQMALVPVPISDDGNCLYRSIAYQLMRNDSFHPIVRYLTVQHMLSQPDDYTAYVGEKEFEKYTSGMLVDRVWGDEMCVHAASRALESMIHVVTSEEHRWYLRYKLNRDVVPRRQLFLAYRSPNHYYCFVYKDAVSVPLIDVDQALSRAAARMGMQLPPQQPPYPLPRAGAATTSPVNPAISPKHQSANAAGVSPVGTPPTSTTPVSSALQPPAVKPLMPPAKISVTLRQTMQQQQQAGVIPTTVVHKRATAPGDAGDSDNRLPPKEPQRVAAAADPTRGGTVSVPSHRAPLPPSNPLPAPRRERPESALRGTRIADSLGIHMIPRLPAVVAVTLWAGSTGSACVHLSNGAATISRKSSMFYLWPVLHECVRHGGRTLPWGPLYDVVSESIKVARLTKKELMPMFLLQDIVTGHFLQCGDDLMRQTAPSHLGFRRATLYTASLQCAAATKETLAQCVLVVDKPVATTKLQLKFALPNHPAAFLVFNNESAFCQSESPPDSVHFVLQLLMQGAPERQCVHCSTWYRDDGQQQSTTSSNGCAHYSHVEAAIDSIEGIARRPK